MISGTDWYSMWAFPGDSQSAPWKRPGLSFPAVVVVWFGHDREQTQADEVIPLCLSLPSASSRWAP